MTPRRLHVKYQVTLEYRIRERLIIEAEDEHAAEQIARKISEPLAIESELYDSRVSEYKGTNPPDNEPEEQP
jgi:hypothetical protein